MKILYLSPIFELSNDPGSDRWYYFCKNLVKSGHQVVVITSAVDYKKAKIRSECRGRLHTVITVDGIKIIYLWSYPNFRGSFTRRLIYLISFMALSVVYGLFVRRLDVIYSPNSPGLVGYAGFLLSIFQGTPLVFEVADVWPDAGIAMGKLTNPYVISIIKLVENVCYRRAERIIALTRGIKENIESKGYPTEKVKLITNGIDPGIFHPDLFGKTKELRSSLGLNHRFVSLYLGAHGHYNSLGTIIEVANCLKDDERFVFVLIGDGDYKAYLEKMVRELSLHNVIFVAPVPRMACPEYLGIADVFLLPNLKGAFFKMNLPNKLFDFLMAGRPIIVAGEGETGDIVRQAGAGFVVSAEDVTGIAESIRRLVDLGETECKKMGEKGQSFVVKNYNRSNQYFQFERTLLEASGQKLS